MTERTGAPPIPLVPASSASRPDDASREYAALRRGALLVDRSQRARIAVTGDRATEAINGLVTNDVGALTAGHGVYAAALTPKGKIAADLRIFTQEHGTLLIDTPPRAAAGLIAILRKYLNPRVAPFSEVTESLVDVGVFGARAAEVIAATGAADVTTLRALPPYGHVGATMAGAVVTIARVPDIAVEGFECFVPRDAEAGVRALLERNGALPAGAGVWDIARVEAGRPEWGIDMDDTTLPQEANLEELHAISFTKGCYTGQETVARIHFRGHVNRHLRGLTFPDEAPPHGVNVIGPDDQPIGDVRSIVTSPRLGRIALAMIRRETAVGASVTARWEGGQVQAVVAALPFPA